ncbi:MAG: signal peptidase I [Clostridiales bacterium]|nr:signal peptidase I [Clostridiales bacterium]
MVHTMICLVCWIIIALLVRQFAVEFVRVKGSSMRSTLQNKEVMLVTKTEYLFGRPKRHDVVICHYPGRYIDKWNLIKQYFVKRVVGLPGETVSIEEGVVHINGVPLEEPFLDEAHNRRKRSMEPVTLKADEYFVMGDNRDNSNDSRRVGPLKRRAIVGQVHAVLWPFRALRRIR